MFLFIHGTGATNSLWLPQIKAIFDFEKSYSDSFLIENFTLQLPGHPDNDAQFTIEDIEVEIEKFRQEKHQFQAKIAEKMVLNPKQSQLAKTLKDPRLVLVGHSVGGVISLHYAGKNFSRVMGLVLLGCGNNFSKIALFGRGFYLRALEKRKLDWLREHVKIARNIRLRVLLSIFAENPARKGFKSCLEIVKHHNFGTWYNQLSLNDQIKFSELPILLINGRFDSLSTIFSARTFKKVLQSRRNIIEPKKTVINAKNNPKNEKFILKIYPWAAHQPMEDNLQMFVADFKRFLRI